MNLLSRAIVARRLPAVLLAAFALLAISLGARQPAAQAVSTSIVISQVYGGGGNSGATLQNDFIELFNRGSTAVSVTGWSVQYASAAGTSWAATPLTGTIQPGRYHLVQEAAGTGGTTALPTPDATGTIAMSATAGKVALVSTTTLLSGSGCPPAATVIDFVGYGSTANCAEGSPAPGLSNTTAALRAAGGCTDTDNNAADFASGAPNPRNTAAPPNPCAGGGDAAPTVTVTSPASNAANVAVNANVTVTFSEPVAVSGTWFTINCATSGAVTATVTGGPQTFTLDPTVDFAAGESCTVTIVAAQVRDQDSIDPPDTLATNVVFTFTAAAPVAPGPRIREIQGAAHVSPRLGQTVSNVPGIVTALRSNGFYLQDPQADTDPATSEGIFVFTSSAPTVAVGASVLVSGTVSEFRPGGSTGTTNLSITQITASGAPIVQSSGNALPAPTVIGVGGRVPPATVIDDDATGDVETSGVFQPATDGIDFYESLEGMRVQVNNAVVVGPTNDFGEIVVLADNGANAALRTPRGGIIVRPADFNPERIFLDDSILPTPVADVRDTFAVAVGVVDYSFGNFKVQITQPLTRVAGGLARETATPAGTDELAVATINVENLDPGDASTKFDALAAIIVTNLRAPDLIAVEEVQDNNGPTNDAVVDAAQTYARLIQAFSTANGPTYAFRQINPVDDADGGEPGGNIRVGFLYRTDRGLSFVDRPGGGPLTATTVVSTPGGPQLSASPGRIDPTNAAFANSRKPLAGEFRFNGRTIFAIANHFNSKGGDQPLFGRFQPPARSSEAQRHQQAQIVNTFVDALLAADADAHIVVMGDFNDFDFSQTLAILKGGVLTNLIDTVPEGERYTYVFEGNSQALDHILASRSLFRTLAGYDIVHVNAEFAVQVSDHDPQVARFALPAERVAPTTTAQATPPPNSAGWNTTNVTVALTATDNPGGSGVKEIVYSLSGAQTGGATVAGASATVAITAEGVTTLTYFARDNAGNQEAAKTLVVRIDRTAPVLRCSVTPDRLRPPNRRLVTVTASVQVSDAGSGAAGFTLVSVTSDEPIEPERDEEEEEDEDGPEDVAGPDGGGRREGRDGGEQGGSDIQGFAIGTADTTGQLRAERLEGGDGRVYTLVYEGRDVAGNTARCTLTVLVPNNGRDR